MHLTKDNRLAYLCLETTQEGQASHAHVHEILKGLARRGWQVELFGPSYSGASTSWGWYRKVWPMLDAQLRLCKQGRQGQVVYVRGHPAAFPTTLWAALRGIPVVQEVNGPFEDLFVAHPWTRFVRPLVRLLARASFSSARAIIAVTPQLAAWAKEFSPGSSVHVVPNGADTDAFHPSAAARTPIQGPYAIFFGSFAKWQGIATLMTAVSRPDWPADVNLVVVGDGMERPTVERAARDNPRVIYLGKRPYGEMPALIAGSLCGLVPKTNIAGHESTGLSPLKLYETLACGVPVIVSDMPGLTDLVQSGGCGMVVPRDDPRALAMAVASLWNDPVARREMGSRGRALAESEHSWDNRAARTEDILLTVLDEGRGECVEHAASQPANWP